MKNSSKKVALYGVFIALAMIMSYIELLIPPIFAAVPGIKLGLPNIIIIYVLYKTGFKSAFFISIVRVLLVAILFGNAMTLSYSIAGAVLSIVLMGILKRTNAFSMIGVSVAGAVMHNIAQVLVAVILLESTLIGYYAIILAITGTISGVLIGVIGYNIIKRF
jgi:heptaprenyl diphosphate synthase